MSSRPLDSSSGSREPKSDVLRNQIEAAFGKYLSQHLITVSAVKEDLEPVVITLTAIGQGVQNSRPTHASKHPEIFRACGRRTAQRELDMIARVADHLAEASSSLHAPTIAALADLGVMQARIIGMAREIAAVARRADVSHLPERAKIVGAPTKEPATTVARIVINVVPKLVRGVRYDLVDRARGVAPLLRQIFRILSIEGNPRYFLEAAAQKPVVKPRS